MKISRRAIMLGAIATPFVAQAQKAWPPSNIRIVVAYPPGGSTDAIMRLVQTPLQDRLGTTIIIENRAGLPAVSAPVGS
jgi:tripartite-type tricarboxylate transporter receptor subunit TctC